MLGFRSIVATCMIALVGAFCAASCTDDGKLGMSSSSSSSGSSSGQGGNAGQGGDNTGGGFINTGGGGQGGGENCNPPDVMLVLDRTMSMHFTPEGLEPIDKPDYPSSKWHQAISAIEALTAPPLDKGIRFGLELWPQDPGGGACITLVERIEQGKQGTNPACEQGEVVISPALDNGAAIQSYLDPAKTTLCRTTPTANALASAQAHLKTIASAGREQYIVLVTDGADWDDSCPMPPPLPVVQELAAAGIKTFIVGFSATGEIAPGGIGAEFLNDMACAGQTAKGFPGPCKQDAMGNWTATDPKLGALYLKSGSSSELSLALKSVGSKLCCNCANACDPPEVLIALDRTMSMHFTPAGIDPVDSPDYKSSKWSQAITSIEKMVAPPRDQGVRFGLELWPRDPGNGCITQAERIAGGMGTNPQCESGEIIVPPALGTGTAIDNALDPAKTRLCVSTPTGNALFLASDTLLKNEVPGREQFVVLVTDGADWDVSCKDPNPLPIVQQLAAGGVRTFIVGFSAQGDIMPGGIGAPFLNDLACAGRTAANFETACQVGPSGYVAKDPNGATLYLQASDSAALDKALTDVVGGLCCNCVK